MDAFGVQRSLNERSFSTYADWCIEILSLHFQLAHEQWGDPDAHGEKTGAKEITTHVSIHSIHPDGLIELHRQFLKLPDGAIVEVSTAFYFCAH